jgi:phage terminase large subunit-like protein
LPTAIDLALDDDREFHTNGPRVSRWIESNCIHGEGDYYGKPFLLTSVQKRVLNRVYEQEFDEHTRRWRNRYSRVLLGMPSGAGKTELLAALAHYQLAHQVSPVIPIAAASKEQANHLFAPARVMCELPDAPLFGTCDPGVNIITLRDRPGRMYRVAAAEGTNEGQGPSTFLADELHAWPETRNTFEVIAKGTAKRADSLQVYISTAGFDKDTICGRLYDLGKRQAEGHVSDPRFLMIWFEAPEDADPEDLSRYHEWHPGVDGGFMSIDALRQQLSSLQRDVFVRYFMNRWTGVRNAWITARQWDALRIDRASLTFPDPGQWPGLHLGVDASSKYDSTAIGEARFCYDADGNERIFVDATIWERPTKRGSSVLDDEWYPPVADEVVPLLWERRREEKAVACQFDPAFFTHEAQKALSEGLPMREFAQQGGKMVEACQLLLESVLNGRLCHDGNPALRRHALNAQARQSYGRAAWRFEKRQSKQQMDGIVAVAMALWSLQHPGEEPRKRGLSVYIPA